MCIRDFLRQKDGKEKQKNYRWRLWWEPPFQYPRTLCLAKHQQAQLSKVHYQRSRQGSEVTRRQVLRHPRRGGGLALKYLKRLTVINGGHCWLSRHKSVSSIFKAVSVSCHALTWELRELHVHESPCEVAFLSKLWQAALKPLHSQRKQVIDTLG